MKKWTLEALKKPMVTLTTGAMLGLNVWYPSSDLQKQTWENIHDSLAEVATLTAAATGVVGHHGVYLQRVSITRADIEVGNTSAVWTIAPGKTNEPGEEW